jgi:hypothetical protein
LLHITFFLLFSFALSKCLLHLASHLVGRVRPFYCTHKNLSSWDWLAIIGILYWKHHRKPLWSFYLIFLLWINQLILWHLLGLQYVQLRCLSLLFLSSNAFQIFFCSCNITIVHSGKAQRTVITSFHTNSFSPNAQ